MDNKITNTGSEKNNSGVTDNKTKNEDPSVSEKELSEEIDFTESTEDNKEITVYEITEADEKSDIPEVTEDSEEIDVHDETEESDLRNKASSLINEIAEQNKEIIREFREETKQKNEERKKEFYEGDPPQSSFMRTLYIIIHFIKKSFSIVMTTLFSAALILLLTGTIVGTAVTVYLLSFMDSTAAVEMPDTDESFGSYIYQKNSDTDEYEVVYMVSPAANEIRLKTDIYSLPAYVKYAFTSIEDERFYSHEGVDYKRTAAAVINLMLEKMKITDSHFGGSTITQQLIKNITEDNEDTAERKMREIFAAMKFEKKHVKDDILEAYLNTIYFDEKDGYNLYGIEAASIAFFGKPASELTLAEAASLAAIPKSPNGFNPLKHYDDNKYRREICLTKMFELGLISPEQYEEAVNEELVLADSEEFYDEHPDARRITENDAGFTNPEVNSWCVDAAINEFAEFLTEKYQLDSFAEGLNMFNHGGYKLYISADQDIQDHLDSTYSDWTYFPEGLSDTGEQIQSSLAVIDYDGFVLGLAGKIGKKEKDLEWNNATDSHRQPGSTIKPVTTYGYAIENDKLTWSSLSFDKALPAGTVTEEPWPVNYLSAPSGSQYTTEYFLKRSLNTLPAQIAYNYGLEEIFRFATDRLHLDLDPDNDISYSPLCVGGTTEGPSALNLANAYLPYGNGGKYYKATLIKKATDMREGIDIIDNETEREYEQAVSEETAYVMNRLLEKVISEGTGTSAQLSGTEVIGKTGTSQNWHDIAFVGLTPDYCTAMWVGYPTGDNVDEIRSVNSAEIWHDVFGTYASDNASGNEFPVCSTVKHARYCSVTGMLATDRCPGNQLGYYKSSNAQYCTRH